MSLEYVLKLANASFVGPANQAKASLASLDTTATSTAGHIGKLGSKLDATATQSKAMGRAVAAGNVALEGTAAAAGIATASLGTLFAGIAPLVLAVAAVATVLKVIPDAVGRAADMEQLNTSFRTLIGNAAQTEKTLGNLRALAASTPFEFPEIAQSARALVAFGEGADIVHETLRRVGDVAAGVGAPLGEVADIYGKARVAGKLMTEDINQLQGRGIPIVGELAKVLGKTNDEVLDMAQNSQITFPLLDQAFRNLTSSGGKFAGQMEAQSRTLNGLWSTFKDSIGETLTALGTPIADMLKPLLLGAIAAADALKARVQALGSVFSAAGAIATAAWANGEMGSAIANVITLGAKTGINALVTLIYSLPAKIQSALSTLSSAIAAAMSGSTTALKTIFDNFKNIGKDGLFDTSKEEAALAKLWQQGKAIQAQRDKAGAGNVPAAGVADGLKEAIAKATEEGAGKATGKAAAAAKDAGAWRLTRPDGTARKPTSADAAYEDGWKRKSDGRSKMFGYTQGQNPDADLYKGIDGWKRLQERGKRMDNGQAFDDPKSARVNDAFNKAGGTLSKAAGALKDTFKFDGLDAMKKPGAIGAKNVSTPGQLTKRQEREAEARKTAQQQQPRWDLVATIEGHFRALAVG